MTTPTDTTIATFAEATCRLHGAHNGTNGCPTCRSIRQARKTLRNTPVRSTEYSRAISYLNEMGQRQTDAYQWFDIGGAT